MRIFISISVFLSLLQGLSSCGDDHINEQKKHTETSIINKADTVPIVIENAAESSGILEQQLMSAGLTDIKTVDSSIIVDLKYSSCDNFLFVDLYGDLTKCYLQPDVAEKLKNAQKILRTKFPYYSLIVYDGVRPRSIQLKMWDTISVPRSERSKYVSNPQNGSLHNFGAAVDLSIIDQNGIVLDMGTPYDFFGEMAYPREEERMIKEGKMTHKQLYNRQILREAMVEAGFLSITTEWWHFNSCLRREAIEKYKIIE
ncbi:MAG: peptidase vanX D-ala-D-ala dipeptidase [Bacteroidetes bacterium]|jgi:D-alanyl-D-alanine dipeptidase|nr:peptidase vanX D-ala-D-ala dipeptidase [Bacteroidota bacterium]